MSRRAISLVIRLAIAVAFIATACSSENAPPDPPSSSEESAEHGVLAECLDRELDSYGVPGPPGPDADTPRGLDHETWQRALRACASLAPGPVG